MSCDEIKLQERLISLRSTFTDAGFETAELDARLLIQAATGLDHAGLILNAGQQLKPSEICNLDAMIQRRLEREPVSRILGQREFYGRTFIVNENVLDPRADTETLIDQALSLFAGDQPIDILDIGSGSGAIIATLLCELPRARGLATDISAPALKVARQNCTDFGVKDRLSFQETAWCADIERNFDLVVSNPPYIVADDIKKLPADVRNFDPLLALDGGKDGLNAYRAIAKQSPDILKPGGTLMVEVGFDQALKVVNIFKAQGFTEPPNSKTIVKDLAGHDRVVTMLWDK